MFVWIWFMKPNPTPTLVEFTLSSVAVSITTSPLHRYILKEDSRLNRLVAELGTTQWSLVAEKLDSGPLSRSGKQCR
jgi:hypothetical protein